MPGGFAVASLLIELCKRGFIPEEKKQFLRWCPGTRCEQREGRNILSLVANMGQDSFDDVQNDDFDGSTAATSNLDVDPNADRLNTRLSR